jgi:hypothetical protein
MKNTGISYPLPFRRYRRQNLKNTIFRNKILLLLFIISFLLLYNTLFAGYKNLKGSGYIKTDENIIINEKAIRWIRKIEDCLYVCSKHIGCNFIDTIKICKVNNIDSYNKLNKHFD